MSLPKLPPEMRGFAEQTKRRLTDVERRLNSALDRVRDRDVFDLQGQIYVSESGDLPIIDEKRAARMIATLKQPGETRTVVQLIRTGDDVAELVLDPGTPRVETNISVPYTVNDLVAVRCEEAGLNAQSLVVVVFWR